MADRVGALRPAEVIRALENAGLRKLREGANHTLMWQEGLRRPVSVPRHAGSIKRPLLLGIIKQAGLTQEEFLQHLRKR